MSDIKKNDFFATLVKNQDLGISDLRNNNITPENSSLLTKEEYKNMPQVKEAFKDDSGKFDEKKFDLMYDNAKLLYTNYASDEFLSNVMHNFTYSPDAWFAPGDANFRVDNPVIAVNKRPLDVSQGISYITSMGKSPTEGLSIREQAQKETVIDSETGEKLDYSPNDKAGLFKRLSLPTLVLAQWDEDGYHIEDGIQVAHKAGDYKLNENYKPYYETLGNRDIYGREVLRNSDILTVDGSNWNKIDFFDSDDIKKSAGKVAMQTVAKIAPMFIPGVGEIYGYLTAAEGIMRVMPVIGKAINGAILGTNDNGLGKTLSSIEGYMSRFDSTQSDYARNHMFGLEGIGNMIGDVSAQLFQQRAVSTIPAIFAKMRGISNYDEVAKVSKGLALSYMAATSAQDVYSDFKEAGANDRTAGLGMIASTLALYKLMTIDYFRDNILKDTFMDESEARNALWGASKATRDKFGEIIARQGGAASQKEASSFIQTISDFYHDELLRGLTKKGAIGLANRGFSEGAEEMIEEATTDMVKALAQGFGAIGINVSDSTLDFNWNTKDFFQRYATSAVGGFIGGMVFAGQNRYEKWLNSKMSGIDNINPNDMQQLVYLIATGHRGEIDEYLDKWHNKGLLGSKVLSVDGTVKSSLDGTSEFIPDVKGMNQNDAVYNAVKNQLDSIQNAIEAEIPNVLATLSPEGLDELRAIGYSDQEIYSNPRLLTASTISALGDYSSFDQDLFKTLSDIVDTKAALEAKIKELSTTTATTEDEKKAQADSIKNNEEVKKLQEKLKKLREEKELFLSGRKNKYYSGQALFAANKTLQTPFVNIGLEDWVKINYGRNLESFTEEEQQKIKEEHAIYVKDVGRNQVYKAFDLYLNLSKQYGAILQREGDNLEKTFEENQEPTILGISDYVKSVEDYNKTLAERNVILQVEEEARTPEQVTKLSELNTKLKQLGRTINIMINNPELSLISKNGNTAVGDMMSTAIPEITLMDDMTAMAMMAATSTEVPNIAADVLNSIRDDYKKAIETGKYKLDDNELLSFLSSVASSYRRAGGVKGRLQLLNQDVQQNRLADDNYFEDDEDGGRMIREDLTYILGQELQGVLESNASAPTISGIVENLIKNIGVNNSAAIAYYNQLMDYFKEKTQLLNPGNEAYLQHILDFLIPKINGESIIDIMNEFGGDEGYIKNVKRSPLFDILAQLGTDVKDLSLFQLIEQESSALSTSQTLEDYLIHNSDIQSSLGKERLSKTLGVAMAVIRGAYDGTNDVMNNFKGSDEDESIGKLATLSDRAAKHLLAQEQEILERIGFLSALSNDNKARALRAHKATALNMRPKWVKALLDIADSFNAEFGIDLRSLWSSETENATLNPSEAEFPIWEAKVIKFEQAIYDAIHVDPSNTEAVQTFANKLLNLVNKKTLFKSPNTKLGENKDSIIGELDLIYHIATLASLPSEKFYASYAAALAEINEENKQSNSGLIIPVYGQEYATKEFIAQTLNPALFNYILDGVCDNADYTEYDEPTKNYLSGKTRLHNLSVVLGGAGAGKTMGVIKTTLKTLTGSNIDVAFIAGEKEQAEKVATAAGFTNYWTVDEYCEKTFGEKVGNYVCNTGKTTSSNSTLKYNGHWEANSSTTYTGNTEIFNRDALKILVIDEIETLTEPELSRICLDAENRGIIIFGAGDLKQPGTDIKGKNRDNDEEIRSSGIEDCAFIKTPTLTTSMRSQTIAKVENTILMSSALEQVLDETTEDPSKGRLDERDTKISAALKSAILYYWEDNQTGELSGDMGVATDEEFKQKIESLSKLDGTIAIITDDVKKYQSYKSDKISVIPYEKRAGGEWDYVLVDVDFKAHDSRGNVVSPYLLTRDFYTLTQRSRKGTVIKTSNYTSTFTFVPNEQKKQVITPNAAQFEEFNRWRLESLSEITPDINGLSENISQSPLLNGYDGKPIDNNSNSADNSIDTNNSSQESSEEQNGTGEEPDSSKSEENSEINSSSESSNSSKNVQETKNKPVEKEQKKKTAPNIESEKKIEKQSETPVTSEELTKEEPTQEEITNTPTKVEKTKRAPRKKTNTKEVSNSIPKAVEKFFLTKEGTAVTGYDLLNAIKGVFSILDRDIQANIDSNKNLVCAKSTDFTKSNKIINFITKRVERRYGKNGVALLEEILAHPTGFNPEDGQKILDAINAIVPNAPTMDEHGKNRKRVKRGDEIVPYSIPGDMISSTNDLFIELTKPEFEANAKSEGLDSYHKLDASAMRLSVNDSNNELIRVINTVGSFIRTGNFSSLQNILKGKINQNALSRFNEFSGGDTKLWIVHYNGINHKGMLVSRHYSKKSNAFFDIPIMMLDNPSTFGRYDGAIEVFEQFHMEFTPDKYITLDDLKTLDPNIHVNSQLGVIKLTADQVKDGVTDVDDATSKTLRENNGKVFATVTDEIATAETLFDASDGYGLFKTDPGKKSVKKYGTFQLTGVQCRTTLAELMKALQIYRDDPQIKLPKKVDFGKYDSYRFLKYGADVDQAAPSKGLNDIKLLKTDKGKFRQLLPKERAGQLITIAALNSANVAFNIQAFMRAVSADTNGKTLHTMVLPYKGGTIEVGIKDNNYIVGTWSNDEIFVQTTGELSRVKIPADSGNWSERFKALFNAIYGEGWETNPPQMHFKNYYLRKDATTPTERAFSFNWEMATMLGGIGNKDIDIIEKAIEDTGKVHGLFMDDHAMFDKTPPDTHWGVLGAEDRVYETNHTKIKNFTTYVININNENTHPSEENPTPASTPVEVPPQLPTPPSGNAEPAPVNPAPVNPTPTPKPTVPISSTPEPIIIESESTVESKSEPVVEPVRKNLASFISKNKLGVTSTSVYDANKELAESDTWKYDYIVETSDGYELRTYGDENLANWLKTEFGIEDDSITPDLMNSIGENQFMISPNGTIINDLMGLSYKMVTDEIIVKALATVFGDSYNSILNNLPREVAGFMVFRKMFNSNNDLPIIMSFLDSNLDIAQKIAIFEDQLEC